MLHRFEAAYVRCFTMLFGFVRKNIVTVMFYGLVLHTFKTIVHNAKVKMASRFKQHSNVLIKSACSAERVFFHCSDSCGISFTVLLLLFLLSFCYIPVVRMFSVWAFCLN